MENKFSENKILKFLISDKLVMLIIIINSLVLFLGAFPDIHKIYKHCLFPIDYVCTIYFVIEAIIKIKMRTWKGYWASGWCKFDFIIVLISTPMLLAPFLNTEEFALILILRIGRLFRFFKLAKFIPNQEKLWTGIKRALAVSVGFLITLCIYNFILAIGAAYLFSDIDPDNFGDPLISMYSMFKVFTIEGWYEIPDKIAENSTPFLGFVARAYFVFTVLTGGLIGLSIANAVFVDEMVADNTSSLEDKVDSMRIEFKHEIEDLKLQNKMEREKLLKDLETLINNRLNE